MFCPEGYVTFYAIACEFDRIADELFEKLTGEGDEEANDFCYTESIIRWAFSYFLSFEIEKIRVGNENGVVLKVGSLIFEGISRNAASFDIDTKDQRRKWNRGPFGGYDEPVFYHIECFTYTIAPCSDLNIIRAFCGPGSSQALQRFVGWSVFWRPSDYKNWRNEVRSILKFLPIDTNVPYRPRLADERIAAKQMVNMFDVNSEITKNVCRTQIRPVLGTLAFGRAWNMAKDQRPGLGYGGRPKSKPQT